MLPGGHQGRWFHRWMWVWLTRVSSTVLFLLLHGSCDLHQDARPPAIASEQTIRPGPEPTHTRHIIAYCERVVRRYTYSHCLPAPANHVAAVAQ